jgi:endonuclease I
VQAEVTDAIATITSVTLSWGTSSGSLPNQLSMVQFYGDFYRTQGPIPAQPEGSTIYYKVRAANDVPASIETANLSYQIPTTVTIHELQSEGPSSLFAQEPVITSGVVAAFIGDYTVLQDGPGSWNGVWVSGAAPYTLGDSVLVRGVVTETLGSGFTGTTVLSQPLVLNRVSGSQIPAVTSATSGTVSREDLEGVTVQLSGVMCTDPDRAGAWAADDGSGECLVGELAFPANVVLGTVYDVTGVLMDASGIYRIQPRDLGDLVFVDDPTPPRITSVSAPNATTVIIAFSESTDPTSAALTSHYTIAGLTVSGAQRDASDHSRVILTVSSMAEGSYSVTVDGVEDLFGNAIASTTEPYDYADYGPPAGYYDGAQGLVGENLRAALHAIIKDHQARSYDFVWSAYYTTDVKPNGKVWDIYSDVPGGTPPYEYTLGVDQGGTGGSEGTGYTREHTWPKSWFGGEVSPMYTDIFALYPCDADVNGHRGNYPYGEVAVPQWISLNGSKLGPCVYPGYSGTVFEPIDAYKGDLARTYFYMSTRYYTEDAGWPGSPMVEGADILPWALSMLLEWNDEDPVSLKELQRNAAVYEYQLNRNPYIDHPEYVHLVFGDITAAPEISSRSYQLSQNSPNPFNPATVIHFSLPKESHVEIDVYDVSGRLVKSLVHDQYVAGEHEVIWRGKDARGKNVASGVYFYSMHAGSFQSSHKMLLAR